MLESEQRGHEYATHLEISLALIAVVDGSERGSLLTALDELQGSLDVLEPRMPQDGGKSGELSRYDYSIQLAVPHQRPHDLDEVVLVSLDVLGAGPDCGDGVVDDR